MIQSGILNPQLLSLIARIRHTNTLVLADWAFPFWRDIETIDISLVKGVPTISQVMEALRPNFKVGTIWQAEEFLGSNEPQTIESFNTLFAGFASARVHRLPHLDFKAMVPHAIGLIRTGDPTPYGNLIIESI